ncbi:MAG TPA: hypothetical protein ENI23_05280 [bacterium]|nr:hypothetical protein [bacterium]
METQSCEKCGSTTGGGTQGGSLNTTLNPMEGAKQLFTGYLAALGEFNEKNLCSVGIPPTFNNFLRWLHFGFIDIDA